MVSSMGGNVRDDKGGMIINLLPWKLALATPEMCKCVEVWKVMCKSMRV